LSDGVVIVRRFEDEDVDALYEAVHESLPALSPWLPWARADYDRQQMAAWIHQGQQQWDQQPWEQQTEFPLGVFDARDNQLVGGNGLNGLDRLNRCANLGYWTRTSHCRRGLAVAATRLVAAFAFEQLDLYRIEIAMSVENHASRRVAEKAGATFEGFLRQRLHLQGRQHDARCYALYRDRVV
jgi:RimJ/RimL family protein N-acetyltransferase